MYREIAIKQYRGSEMMCAVEGIVLRRSHLVHGAGSDAARETPRPYANAPGR